ncbi:MAG: translocation and assembly module TamA [Gammaproteobacteria bacterium]|jgi:translocation and assembly module TamA
MFKSFLFLFLFLFLSGCSWLPFGRDDATKSTNGESANAPMVNIEINGVGELVADNVRIHIGISKKTCSLPFDLIKRRYKKTMAETNLALQAFGYYEAQVSLNVIDTPGCPTVEIDIAPGRRMLVSAVDIVIKGAASEDLEFKKLTRELPIKAGDVLNHGQYTETKALIESVAAELGYLDGRFTESILHIDMEKYEARVSLEYKSVDRYKLGDINITQEPDFLDEGLIRRFLEIPLEGDYSAGKVVNIQNRLLESNYFKSVEARPRLSNPEDRAIPVDVIVHANERHHFEASVGFATDEGIRSKLGYTDRRWNRRGHRLGAETKLSQNEQGFSANYQIPRRHPSNEWLQITAGLRQQNVDSFDTLSAKISVSENKRRFWGIMENHFIAISRDDFEIGDETGIARFLIPGIRWNKRVVDDEIFPSHGLDMSFEVRGATDALISDTNFLSGDLHVHYLKALPFGFRSFIRSDIGGMWVDDFRVLPPSERFFAGGDNSIRGYDYQDLGPINNTGNVIGGRYLGVVSFEIEKYISGNWGVAGFVDTGNAFGGPGRNTGLKTGVGLGLRWLSPVGPVRVDLAHPLDEDDTLLKLHLRIGPDL